VHASEAIISSRASAHRLHEVLLSDRKFIVISYQIKKSLAGSISCQGFLFRESSFKIQLSYLRSD